MQLVQSVADATTPLDAIRRVRDWLETRGHAGAASVLHEETFVARGWGNAADEWRNERDVNRIINQFQDEVDALTARLETEWGEGHDDGYQEGFAAGQASMSTLPEEASDAAR